MATWTPLGRDIYSVTWQGMTWRLEATPKGSKYPWLLTCEHRKQAINAGSAHDARLRAELWLGLAKYVA